MFSGHSTSQSQKICVAHCALVVAAASRSDLTCTVSVSPSPPILPTTCRTPLVRNLARTQQRSMGSTTFMLWKSTRPVQFKRWSRIVRLHHYHVSLCSLIHLPADQNGMMGSMMQDLAFAIPGVDEAMGFAEIMKCGAISFF